MHNDRRPWPRTRRQRAAYWAMFVALVTLAWLILLDCPAGES